MTHGRQKPLVPITRDFLKQFYQRYPLSPVPYEARLAHVQRIDALALEVTKPGSKVPEQFGMPSPTRIDDCFWRNRMICEELALSMSKLQKAFFREPDLAAACARSHDLLVDAERGIFAVQERNTASVKAQLQQFIPQDFRGALLERQRASTEARFKKQVDDLVRRGGTIRQKYDLYLQQQWERRQSLVQLGECSGMYKMVIKWVAGIPQVLLDFAKEINAKLGPMEEQRIKYGPDLYAITELGIRLDVCLAAWAEAAEAAPAPAAAATSRMAGIVEPAVGFYCAHMLRVVRHIGDVFQHSPFFVNKEDLQLQGAAAGCTAGEVREAESAAAAAATAAAAEKHHQQHLGADIECGSSTLSVVSVSANGDYGAATAAGAAAKTPAGAAVVVAPLPLPLTVAPSVTPPSTPGMVLEPHAPRSAQMLTSASAGSGRCGADAGAGAEAEAEAVSVTPAARPEKQQLIPRFDAKVGGSGAAATMNATVASTCGGSAATALHRIATPPPRELVAAAVGVVGHGHGAPPHSGSRAHLSMLSLESQLSFVSAMEHHTWLIAEECELDAAWPGEVEQPAAPSHNHHHHHNHHQHQRRSSSSPHARLPVQPLQYLAVLQPQPQPQPQVVVIQAEAQGQAPVGVYGGYAAGATAAAPEAAAAGGGGGVGGGGEVQEVGERAVKAVSGRGVAAGRGTGPSEQPPSSRPAAAGGCFRGCFGRGR